MRGLVMILMVIDHASMAFDGHHVAEDSALYPTAATMALPAAEFFTRWITHLCAPTFVFLAGTALALSVERRVVRGVDSWEIDKGILIRGAIVALLDPTIISIGSGRWTFQVLFAIGVSMMCMAPLRRLPSWALVTLGVGLDGARRDSRRRGSGRPQVIRRCLAAFTVATYGSNEMIVKYPVLPWLAIMVLGWVFGRHLIRFAAGLSTVSGKKVLWISGMCRPGRRSSRSGGCTATETCSSPDQDNSWQQWLHVSKYPPSLTYYTLELGILFLCSGAAQGDRGTDRRPRKRRVLRVRPDRDVLLPRAPPRVRDSRDLSRAAGLRRARRDRTRISGVALLALYPACRWYRTMKARHPQSFLKYF